MDDFKLKPYWKSICQIYFLTKHYLLIAEELSEDFDTFLQPVKEHRDAFDHVARVYGIGELEKQPNNVEKYQIENLKKAIGHTYRAFFDTADWLSYVCRKEIRKILSQYSREQILNQYPNYDSVKNMLIAVPKQIADIRSTKDLSDDESLLIDEVRKYSDILDQLIEVHSEICKIF